MRDADFAFLLTLAVRSQAGGAVVGAHVVLEGLAVGAGGRLPSALLGRGIEIIREILGVGVSDLPAARKTCSLRARQILLTGRRASLEPTHHFVVFREDERARLNY